MQRAAASQLLGRTLRSLVRLRAAPRFSTAAVAPRPTPPPRKHLETAAAGGGGGGDGSEQVRRLPVTCSGCGAFSQTGDPRQPGYYDAQSKRVRIWARPATAARRAGSSSEDELVEAALRALDTGQLAALGLSPETMMAGLGAAAGSLPDATSARSGAR